MPRFLNGRTLVLTIVGIIAVVTFLTHNPPPQDKLVDALLQQANPPAASIPEAPVIPTPVLNSLSEDQAEAQIVRLLCWDDSVANRQKAKDYYMKGVTPDEAVKQVTDWRKSNPNIPCPTPMPMKEAEDRILKLFCWPDTPEKRALTHRYIQNEYHPEYGVWYVEQGVKENPSFSLCQSPTAVPPRAMDRNEAIVSILAMLCWVDTADNRQKIQDYYLNMDPDHPEEGARYVRLYLDNMYTNIGGSVCKVQPPPVPPRTH